MNTEFTQDFFSKVETIEASRQRKAQTFRQMSNFGRVFACVRFQTRQMFPAVSNQLSKRSQRNGRCVIRQRCVQSQRAAGFCSTSSRQPRTTLARRSGTRVPTQREERTR